ncbi:hypothetical protein FOZ62_011257, partial [Perkinsus olseni]
LEWKQVKHFAGNWHLPDVLSPTTIRSLERHYTFSNLLTRLIEQDDAYETGLAVVLQDCLPGVLVVILNALAAIDFEFGKDKASEWLTMAKTLALKYFLLHVWSPRLTQIRQFIRGSLSLGNQTSRSRSSS